MIEKFCKRAKRSFLLVVLGCIALVATLPEVQCAPASFEQAVADYKAGHVSTALSEFQSYKLAYPTNALVRYYIGLCYEQLGRFDEARAELLWVNSFGDAHLQGLSGAALKQIPTRSSTPAAGRTGSSESAQVSEGELEAYCLSLINESRRQEGLSPLVLDGSFARMAQQYANYMAQNSEQFELSVSRSPHIDLQGRNQMQRAAAAGLATRFTGECIGRTSRGGNSDKTMILTVHRQMMSEAPGSGGHRDNIMNPDATVVGVGIARLPKRQYLVEEFGQR
jgi:uncharacterized protein YkwD